MGVKRVKTAPKAKSKATPKKATPLKKLATPKKDATPKVKPVTKANNVATPKPTPAKKKPAPKKKTPQKKAVSNNTPAKKEVNNTAPSANDVSVGAKGKRKRAAPKIENDVPAKKVAKEKPTPQTPAAGGKARGRGRPGAKANNVVSKVATVPTTPAKLPETTPAKATNNTDKKQSKPKQAKKSPAKAKKAVSKTPKKPRVSAGKLESAKVSKAKTTGGKRAKRTPAAKTKSVLLNPVVEIEPLEHPEIKQAKMNPLIVLRRIDLSSKVKFINMNPVIRLSRIDLYQQATRKNVAVLVPRVRFCIRNSISNTRDITEHDSPQNNKQNVPICLPEIDSSSRSYGSTSTDAVTPSQGISYENDWFSKKYKPYMEKLRNLTYDEISNFVKNNKEQYEKLKDTKKPTKGNSANTDTKDLFKCNPFNSEQQLAMYLTLRELFNVPETHFKQCKSFFTVVLPEISCQLFAQTFNIKVGSAPRLIKKLYPDPISPF